MVATHHTSRHTGTGKTFGIAVALKNRVHPPRIPEVPREITVIHTVSNHAVINVAKALVDRNVIGFKLGLTRFTTPLSTGHLHNVLFSYPRVKFNSSDIPQKDPSKDWRGRPILGCNSVPDAIINA
jgi:hypothetical protein